MVAIRASDGISRAWWYANMLVDACICNAIIGVVWVDCRRVRLHFKTRTPCWLSFLHAPLRRNGLFERVKMCIMAVGIKVSLRHGDCRFVPFGGTFIGEVPWGRWLTRFVAHAVHCLARWGWHLLRVGCRLLGSSQTVIEPALILGYSLDPCGLARPLVRSWRMGDGSSRVNMPVGKEAGVLLLNAARAWHLPVRSLVVWDSQPRVVRGRGMVLLH